MKQEFSSNYPRPLAWNYELLADYVDGLVDQATHSKIDTALKDSEEAAMIVSGIRFYYRQHGEDREGLEEYLDELAEQFGQRVIKPEAKIRRFPFSPKIMRVAAVVLLLIASVPLIIWLTKPANPDPNAFIAQQLSTPYSIISTTRGDSSDINKLTQAYEAYKVKNYAETITLLTEIKQEQSLSDYDQLVLGLSLLYEMKYTESAPVLKEVVEKENPRIEQQARWFLALTYHQMGEKEKSIQLLDEILQYSGHYKAKEAKELLEMNEF